MGRKISSHVNGGLSGGSFVPRRKSKDPHRRSACATATLNPRRGSRRSTKILKFLKFLKIWILVCVPPLL